MQNICLSVSASGLVLFTVFSIVWIIQTLFKKNRTVTSIGVKLSGIVFLLGFSLAIGVVFTAIVCGIIAFIKIRKKKKNIASGSSDNKNRPFFPKLSKSEAKKAYLVLACSLIFTVWATIDFSKTQDITAASLPSETIEETNNEAEQEANEEDEEKAAQETAAKEAAQKAIEEVTKEVEQKAAQEAAAKEAEQKAAQEAAAKEAEQKAAQEAAAKEAEQKAAQEAAAKEAELKATQEAAVNEVADTEEYVLNTNTRKFHHSWCSSAKRIKASNYSTCVGRDNAIAMGYSPCGNCHP